MKKKNFLDAFETVDPEFIEESDPANFKRRRQIKRRRILSVIAACLCITLITASLVLFLPLNNENKITDISKYKDNDYFNIIDRFNDLRQKQLEEENAHVYKNNYEKLIASLKTFDASFSLKSEGRVFDGGVAPDNADFENEAAPSDTGAKNGSTAVRDITDNQVDGVIEGDMIKRSRDHIFYLCGGVLNIYSIDKENSELVGSYDFKNNRDGGVITKVEFYLTNDHTEVIAIMQIADSNAGRAIFKAIALDVSDPASPTIRKEISGTGRYLSTRLVDDKLLIVSELAVNTSYVSFDNTLSFLPALNTGDGMKPLSSDDITVPETLLNTRYTVVSNFDPKTLELHGTKAFLSFTDDIYVTPSRIYLFRVFSQKIEDVDTNKKDAHNSYYKNDYHETMTEITCLDYDTERIEKAGNITVRGYVKDQYSLDEYNGILRVVTTTNDFASEYPGSSYGEYLTDSLARAWGRSNASLYCIDTNEWKVVSSVIDFAPPREEVQSVRFDKNTGYVCTSIEMSDPVFFFDLSDINNITYKETGTIEGFSSSLVNFGDGVLLGIGTSSWSNLKIEIYEEASDKVVPVCSHIEERTDYSKDYKAYYIDRENQMVGLAILDYKDKGSDKNMKYLLLSYDGYKLNELTRIPLSGKTVDLARGVYIDGYLYVLCEDDFVVKNING